MATIVEQLQQRLRLELKASKMRLSVESMEFQRTYAKKPNQYKWKLVGDGRIVVVSLYQVRELLKSSPSWVLTKQGNYIVVAPRPTDMKAPSRQRKSVMLVEGAEKIVTLIPRIEEIIKHTDQGLITPQDALVELGAVIRAAFNILATGVNR